MNQRTVTSKTEQMKNSDFLQHKYTFKKMINLNFKTQGCLFLFLLATLLISTNAAANNLSISDVVLKDRNPSSNTVVVEFDVSWDNSWRTKINHDAVWTTVRLYDPSSSPTDKKLCDITQSGLNPTGTSVGSNADLEFYVPSDKKGVFIRPSTYGVNSSVTSSSAQVTVDYDSCGFSDSASVYVNVSGVEMVYVPEGEFYAGDYNTSSTSLVEGSADSDPWYVSGESALSVSNPVTDGFRYVSGNNAGEDITGTSFTIPSDYPKGYAAFYAMKYEITEGQWVEFLNSLPTAAARANRDATDSTHKNSDTVKFRNTVSCSGSPLLCSTSRPARAMTYLTWMDVTAYLDWMALRPMTELEYEKASRGPMLSIAGEFAWGTSSIVAVDTISGTEEDGSETILTSGATANYNNTTFSGGDSSLGADYQKGALRSGALSTSDSTRVTAGAGYYGMLELSGNVKESVVTIGNISGRSFEGSNGDGLLSTDSGYEGNATNVDWPGIDGVDTRGVTGAAGSGYRGGSWSDQSSGSRLRVSDRSEAAYATTTAGNNSGGRGVRTYDGS